jgi:bile acid:Na+ symporter, BASS family
MELLSNAVPITMLAFVVSSMLAVGLSLTIRQIVAPPRNGKLVFLVLLASFVLMWEHHGFGTAESPHIWNNP